MIHRTKLLIFSIFILISVLLLSSNLYAGAAEKWEYEPVMKNMNIEVKAHKVDQYGAAVNDYEYNTKIDPKTDANRTKMGKVGFGRLFKSTGWGLLGSVALEALLKSVDWIIDPESQSIWRNKKPDPNGSFNCSGGFQFQNNRTQQWFACPLAAAENWVSNVNQTETQGKYTFVRFQNDPYTSERVLWTVHYEHYTYPVLSRDMPNQELARKPDPNSQPESKEYLTPETLADYANHTHPDYSNPELAPKLEPKYSPEIASDLWKPSNPWEETNSPTVQEVNKKLDEAQPEPKKDPELTPNPETGGMTLPSFCSWAAPVCEFIKWMKEPPEIPERQTEVDIQETPVAPEENNYLQWNAYCPFTAKSDEISINGETSALSSDLTSWCTMASEIKPYVLLAGALASLMIVSGVGLGRSED